MSLLVISEILGLFDNALTSNDKYFFLQLGEVTATKSNVII